MDKATINCSPVWGARGTKGATRHPSPQTRLETNVTGPRQNRIIRPMSLNTFTYLRALSGVWLCFTLRRMGGVNDNGVGSRAMRNNAHLHSDHPKCFRWQKNHPFRSHDTRAAVSPKQALYLQDVLPIVLSHLAVFTSSPNVSFTLITRFKSECKLSVSNSQSFREEFVQIIKIHETSFVNKLITSFRCAVVLSVFILIQNTRLVRVRQNKDMSLNDRRRVLCLVQIWLFV